MKGLLRGSALQAVSLALLPALLCAPALRAANPTSGTVSLSGCDPFRLDERELAAFRNKQVGFVFQDHHLLPQCSVLENVLIPTLVAQNGSADLEARARSLLDKVGLSHRLRHRPAELSGGEKQRVALARALILKPALLLCDEPTGNLDTKTSDEIMQLFQNLNEKEGITIVLVTHEPDIAEYAHRQIVFRDGSIISDNAKA